MRRPALLGLVSCAGLPALAACAPRPAAEAAAPDGPVETEDALVSALERAGFVLAPRGFSADRLVATTASEYAVEATGRGSLQVYTFESEAEARRSLGDIATAGAARRTRVYQRGPLVVVYAGSDLALADALARRLGPATV